MRVLPQGGLLLILLGLCTYSTPVATRNASIAVIGAGIGGSAAAYFLRHELGNETDIEVFERARAGGRTQVFKADGRIIEMGASIIHEQNKYFRDLADSLHLKRIEPGSGDKESQFSIFDGQYFVFNQSSWSVVTLYRLLRRYGLSYFRFQGAPRAMASKFAHIYELQGQGRAFGKPEQLLQAINLFNLTQLNMRSEAEAVIGSGVGATHFTREVIGSINHINYNQDNGLNAFAGMVSMLPTVDSSLFALEGGNYQLAVRLLQAARARVHQPQEVRVIAKANGSYYLHAEGDRKGPFAAVVIAAPLEGSNLSFEGFQMPHLPPRKYQTTVTTVVRGSLSPGFFKVAQVPRGEYIMVAEGAALPFSVIAPISGYENGTRLYKVFSDTVLTEATAASLFGEHSIVARHVWKAYPRFHPPEQFAPFELADGLFYNNALENAASAMEVAIIEAKNSALLTKRFLDHKANRVTECEQRQVSAEL